MLTARWCVALIVCLGPGAASTWAQPAPATRTSVFEVTRSGTSVAMTIGADGVPLDDLLDFVRKETGIAFSTDARESAELRVRINGVQTVESKDLLAWLRSVLASMDLTLLPFGTDAQKLGQPAFFAVRIANGNVRPGYLKAFAPFIDSTQLLRCSDGEETLFTTVFPLKYANAQESTNLLQSYFSDPLTESARASMQSNCVVITGRLRSLRTMQKVIAALDQEPDDPAASEVVYLRFVPAESISAALVQWARGGAADARMQPMPGPAVALDLDVVPYAERNAIIVSGPTSRVAQAKALVALLDVEAKKP